jgi:uncharacterized protein (DUF58 family)
MNKVIKLIVRLKRSIAWLILEIAGYVAGAWLFIADAVPYWLLVVFGISLAINAIGSIIELYNRFLDIRYKRRLENDLKTRDDGKYHT